MRHLPGGGITARYEGLYALGLGLLAFGFGEVTVANGLVATFVCGLALGMAEHEAPEAFVGFNENLSAIFQVITFVAFGALIATTGYGGKGVASMLFALFVLNSQAPDRSLVFDVAAFVILASILAHGLTDTLGARWIERRLGGQRGGSSG